MNNAMIKQSYSYNEPWPFPFAQNKNLFSNNISLNNVKFEVYHKTLYEICLKYVRENIDILDIDSLSKPILNDLRDDNDCYMCSKCNKYYTILYILHEYTATVGNMKFKMTLYVCHKCTHEICVK